MTSFERILVPTDAEWARVAAAVRPEYRVPILVPPRGSRLFNNGPCEVPGCTQTVWSRRSVCGAHAMRWFQARRAGSSWQDWLASASPHTSPQPCIVEGCGYGRQAKGLCHRHAARWHKDGAGQSAEQWAEGADLAGMEVPREECTIPHCTVWRHGNLPMCSSDMSRWRGFRKKRPNATVEDFIEYVERMTVPAVDVTGLSPRLTLEVQYIFQSWVDRGTKRADLYGWNIALRVLREAAETSILEAPTEVWLQRVKNGSARAGGLNNYSAEFFRWGWNELDVLLHGTGWEREYPRDVWRLAHIGHPEFPKRTLDFAPIGQPWLRDLAKQWVRHRLSVGMAVKTVEIDMMALHHFSSSLSSGGTAPTSPAQLRRSQLEAWMAQAAVRFPQERTRRKVLSSISTFLRAIHQYEWAPEMPAGAMLHRDDFPRQPKSMPGRAISEFVMAQIEAPDNLAKVPDPAYRTVLELMIRCGLRAIDAVDLSLDCVIRDDEGQPYLHYLNHKMKRDAYVPIDNELADRLRRQREAVEARYPEGTATKMFPGRTANIHGRKATTVSGFQHAVQEWLDELVLADEYGKPVRVTPHQFRHTFGTRLINNDVAQHVVQQLMDHASPEMTNHYARLRDKTLRRAWEKARKINAEGREVELDETHPLAAAQWLRTGIARAKQTLPNGYCGMPIQSDCAHANPCLTCPLFITTPEFLPQHESQLRTTLTLIQQSDAAGHVRIAEKNRQIADNLGRIIEACKGCAPSQVVVGGKPTTDEKEADAS